MKLLQPLFLGLLYSIAIAVYVTTGDPTCVALIPYITAAWPSAETAGWLWRHDPVRFRGQTCFQFYLAYAGIAASLRASIALLVLFVATLITGQEPPIDNFIVVMLTLIAGWLFSCVIGWIGTVLALIRHVSVYIVPNLKARCSGDFHNMSELSVRIRGMNRAVIVVTSTLSVPFLSVGFGLLIYAAPLAGPEGQWMAAAGLTLLSAGGIVAVLAVGFVSGRVAASTPAMAWPEYFVIIEHDPRHVYAIGFQRLISESL